MGLVVQMIFISRIYFYVVMEIFVIIKYVIVNLIYVVCFLEGQFKMVQLYIIMKYIKKFEIFGYCGFEVIKYY